jgi:hypothetical protein
MITRRRLLVAGLAAVLIVAVAAVPALAKSGRISTTDRSGHAAYKITERKDPDGGVRKTLVIKACDDRKDGAGITVVIAPDAADLAARGGAGTCTKARVFSGSGRVFANGGTFSIRVCRQDASKDGPFVKCRNRTL